MSSIESTSKCCQWWLSRSSPYSQRCQSGPSALCLKVVRSTWCGPVGFSSRWTQVCYKVVTVFLATVFLAKVVQDNKRDLRAAPWSECLSKLMEVTAAGNRGFLSYKHVLNNRPHSALVSTFVLAREADQLARMFHVGLSGSTYIF